MNPHTPDLLALQSAADRVGQLQGRLRLDADTVAPGPIRDALTEAADVLDRIDERLTQAFVELAPAPGRRRRGKAA
jgi:hypothetical protein